MGRKTRGHFVIFSENSQPPTSLRWIKATNSTAGATSILQFGGIYSTQLNMVSPLTKSRVVRSLSGTAELFKPRPEPCQVLRTPDIHRPISGAVFSLRFLATVIVLLSNVSTLTFSQLCQDERNYDGTHANASSFDPRNYMDNKIESPSGDDTIQTPLSTSD